MIPGALALLIRWLLGGDWRTPHDIWMEELQPKDPPA